MGGGGGIGGYVYFELESIAFEQIFEVTYCEFRNKGAVLRRFANTFQKGNVKSKSDVKVNLTKL